MWADIDHEKNNADDDFVPSQDRRICSILCDEEHEGIECENYADVLIKDEYIDTDGVFWNHELASGLKMLGWKITPDHDYCPVHANANVKKDDANASLPVSA